MRQYFELDPKEKYQDYILLTIATLTGLTVAVGLYFEAQNINHNNILIPIFFFFIANFFLLYSINALTNGNLTLKWTPTYISKSLLFLYKKLRSSPEAKPNRFVTRLLGLIGLIISIGLFIATLISIIKYKW